MLACVAFVLLATLWPSSVDQGVRNGFGDLVIRLARAGIHIPFGYRLVEWLANVAFFVPLGATISLWLRPSRWWLAPLLALILSTAVELTQATFLAGRVGSVLDVAANTLGALIGSVIVALIRRAWAKRRRVPRIVASTSS